MSKLSLNCSRIFKCKPKLLWQAITDGAFLSFTGPIEDKMSFNFEEGGKYSMEWEECAAKVEGVFLQIIPERKVVFSWNKVKESADDDSYQTVVTLELSEHSGATLLSLVHEGFETYELIEDHTSGWKAMLKAFMESLTDQFELLVKGEKSLDLYRSSSIQVKAPVADVFNAVKSGELLSQYFPVNHQDDFVEGQAVRWNFTGEGEFKLHTHLVVENKTIKFLWGQMHVCFNFRPIENNNTEVSVDFTTLENDQSGLGGFASECDGWGQFLLKLKLFIEKDMKLEDYRL